MKCVWETESLCVSVCSWIMTLKVCLFKRLGYISYDVYSKMCVCVCAIKEGFLQFENNGAFDWNQKERFKDFVLLF